MNLDQLHPKLTEQFRNQIYGGHGYSVLPMNRELSHIQAIGRIEETVP